MGPGWFAFSFCGDPRQVSVSTLGFPSNQPKTTSPPQRFYLARRTQFASYLTPRLGSKTKTSPNGSESQDSDLILQTCGRRSPFFLFFFPACVFFVVWEGGYLPLKRNVWRVFFSFGGFFSSQSFRPGLWLVFACLRVTPGCRKDRTTRLENGPKAASGGDAGP